jgi:hypothetical protein
VNGTRGWLIWILMGPASLAAAESPEDFAFGLPIVTSIDAAAYRFTLPLVVYQNTFGENLADVRVYNAQDEVVPYSLLGIVPSRTRSIDTQLPLFPLPSGSRVAIDGVRVTIEAPGSALNLQTQPSGAANGAVSQYILDGRELTTAVEGLRLDWSATDLQYSGRIRVEASDDLGVWQMIASGAPVANLRANGQAIIQNRVSLAPTKAKFWRISWLGTAPALKLESVFAEFTDGPPQDARVSLDVAGTLDPSNPEYYLFDLGAHAPIDRVTLLLPEINTLANIEYSSRKGSIDAWRSIARTGVFRIAAADGDLQNAPLKIGVDRDRYWRIRWNSPGGASQGLLRLHVEWIPDRVVFLARGRGPFLLTYGNSTASAAEVDLNQMPASVEIGPATLGSPQVLGGPSRLQGRAAPFRRMPFALWTALILAVAGLAWMAWRLVAEGASPPKAKEP